MEQKRRIIFRADGNSRIGLGHVTRSLALAAMLREEFECVFAIQAPDKALQEQIRKVCQGIIVLPPAAATEDRFSHELSAYISEEEIVVLDGYSFDTSYQENIRARGSTLVCIDDIHSYRFVADAVINQAGGILPKLYQAAPYTKLLLGPRYALLRPPFLTASRRTRSLPAGQLRVLLCMGGADPDNHTLQALADLQAIETAMQVEVVVGSAYTHLPELKRWLQDKEHISLHSDLSAEGMRRLMSKCQVAVTSASGISYEYAAVGGLLFVKQTADNQAGIHHFLITNGIASDYSMLQQQLNQGIAEDTFRSQVAAQRQHFDGKSDERLRQLFRHLSLAASLTLREASPDDLLLLFEWANDPEVRSRSFNPEPIPLENHTRWFQARLENPDTKIYLAEANGIPAAQIRFDVNGATATISYLISAGYRGNGLGHTILLKGVQKLRKQRPDVHLVEGLVQQGHSASIRSFEKAGFDYAQPDAQHPQAHRFVLELPAKLK
ncbi:glycosyltransferase [Pontibacter sp. HJ8]